MPNSTRPNILFLLSDEHSFRCFSHLDPAGEGEPVRTPHLDRLAQRSCRFHHAYCQVPLCSPSRIGLLTGKDPMGSGGWDNGSILRPDVLTLPGQLAESGYTTALFGKMHLGGSRQFVGFQHRPYGDLTGDTGHQPDPIPTPRRPDRDLGCAIRSRTADAGPSTIPEPLLQENVAANAALAFLRQHRHARPDRPWFACLSLSRPHFPLTSPSRFLDRYFGRDLPSKVGRTGDTADHPMTRGMAEGFRVDEMSVDEANHARAAYFANVDFLDEIIGDFLAGLERSGLLDDTIVIYTSDHGELAGEHGLWWKNSWHEAAARVPLIIQTPEHRDGAHAPAVFDTPVSLADLMPTLLGLADAPVPDDLDGHDLGPAIATNREPDRGPVFYTNPTARWGLGTEHCVIREGRWKHVRFRGVGPDLLFDLERDPLEQSNRIEQEPAVADRLGATSRERWNFDDAQAAFAKDQALLDRYPRRTERCTNAWHLPDGRVVDADAPLYHPRVISTDINADFSDAPSVRLA